MSYCQHLCDVQFIDNISAWTDRPVVSGSTLDQHCRQRTSTVVSGPTLSSADQHFRQWTNSIVSGPTLSSADQHYRQCTVRQVAILEPISEYNRSDPTAGRDLLRIVASHQQSDVSPGALPAIEPHCRMATGA